MLSVMARAHGYSSNDKVVYDSLGNRRFRVCVTPKLGERLKKRAKAEGISITKLVSSAFAHWVVRRCPSPVQDRDHPKVFVQDGRQVLIVSHSIPHGYAITIWLHAEVHGPAVEAFTRYRAGIAGKMGAALFPTPWVSRIVAAYLDDNWKGFTDAEAPQGTPQTPEPSPEAAQRPLAGGGDGVLPPPA